MTLAYAPASTVYTGDGTTAAYNVKSGSSWITFAASSDIKVTVLDIASGVLTPLFEGTDYTLTGGALGMGVVTLTAGNLAAGKKIAIYRDEAIGQDTSFISGTSFPALSVEQALDRQCRLSQQIFDTVARSIVISRFDSFPNSNLEIPLDRAEAVLAFDAAGNVQALKPGSFASGLTGASCSINWLMDGAGFPIASGYSGEILVPFGMTITGWTLMADIAGILTVDIWKTTLGSFPPVLANSITGSQMPRISGTAYATSTSLPSWQTAIAANDVLGFNVAASATVSRATIALQGTRT